jgi:DNA invertase Pin-like site-specific DNA recombinase
MIDGNMKNIIQNKYILYTRKSTEEDDRQVLSIESQTNELKSLAKKLGLTIIKTISESKSAKDIGRIGFNEVLEIITNGKADGILCWKMDRLSRNPIDSGRIQYMLQKSSIKSIQTIDKEYLPEDNVLLSSIEFGMSNEYIRMLSVNVKRGLKTKAEKGWYPGKAKSGYLNEQDREKGDARIIEDPIGFPLLKRALEEMLTGLYRPSQVHNKLINEWGYRSPKRRKSGGGPLALSTFYSILSDTFYCGEYEYPVGSGNWYKGSHTPMITPAQFDRLQEIIGKKDNPRPRIKNSPDNAFYGLLKCHSCGSSITPDTKIQTICAKCKHKFSSIHKTACPKCGTEISDMKNPVTSKYTYYGCTKRRNSFCSQASFEGKELDKQVIELLKTITISENMKNWYISQLNEISANEVDNQTQTRKALQENFNNIQKRLGNLLNLKISPQNTNGEVLNDEDYIREKLKLNKEAEQIKEKIEDTEDRSKKWMNSAVDAFNFACYAKYHYENGDIEAKKAILLGLSTNLLIKDKKILISLPKHLELICSANSKIRELGIKTEPEFLGLDKEKTGLL